MNNASILLNVYFCYLSNFKQFKTLRTGFWLFDNKNFINNNELIDGVSMNLNYLYILLRIRCSLTSASSFIASVLFEPSVKCR